MYAVIKLKTMLMLALFSCGLSQTNIQPNVDAELALLSEKLLLNESQQKRVEKTLLKYMAKENRLKAKMKTKPMRAAKYEQKIVEARANKVKKIRALLSTEQQERYIAYQKQQNKLEQVVERDIFKGKNEDGCRPHITNKKNENE